jgi:hypothetical protein
MDYASPVSGSGMGKLSSLTGGKSSKMPSAVVPGLLALAKETKGSGHTQKTTGKVISKYPFYGGAVDALEVSDMMQRGANRARGTMDSLGALSKGSGFNPFDIVVDRQPKVTPKVPMIPKTGGRKPSARNMIVKKIMKQRGVSLPEASKIVKAEGLY